MKNARGEMFFASLRLCEKLISKVTYQQEIAMNSHRPTVLPRLSRSAFNLQFAIGNWQFPLIAFAGLLVAALLSAEAYGQNSSLSRRRETKQQGQQGMTLDQVSWTYQKVPAQRPLDLNDQVTVWVDSSSVVISEGQMDRKKNAYGSLTLKDWILLKGLSVIPDPQSAGDPKIRGEVDNKLTSKANLETRDSMKFKMACKVVDIRPNGILVIEGINAHRQQRRNVGILADRRNPRRGHAARQCRAQPERRQHADRQTRIGPRPRRLPPRLGAEMAR